MDPIARLIPWRMRPAERITLDLIEACRRGDRDAFGRLVDACGDRVYALAWHLSGSDTLAADIAQDVFVKMLTRIGQFRNEAEFSTWLYRVIANTAIDYQRSRRRLVPVEDATPRLWHAPAPEHELDRTRAAARVREAMARLAPRFRVPLILRYVEDLSYDEIARILNVSPGTVASRLSRGLRHLGRELRAAGADVP